MSGEVRRGSHIQTYVIFWNLRM